MNFGAAGAGWAQAGGAAGWGGCGTQTAWQDREGVRRGGAEDEVKSGGRHLETTDGKLA